MTEVSLLGYEATSLDNCPICPRCLGPELSTFEYDAATLPRNVGNGLPIYTASHPTRTEVLQFSFLVELKLLRFVYLP